MSPEMSRSTKPFFLCWNGTPWNGSLRGMFGFMAPPCARCTGGSFPAWRGTFCGLSRCLAREFGQPARVLVNRDAAFVGLIGVCLDPRAPGWKPATCCNPLAARFPVVDDHPAVAHAAAATMCGLAVKLDDDSQDEGPFRRVVAAVARKCVTPAAGRAVALLNASSFPTAMVSDALAQQSRIEEEEPQRADEPTAQAFGTITSHLASLLDLPTQRDRLETVGRSLGALVYWRDAWDDREEDARRGRFNPFQRVDSALIRERVTSAWSAFSNTLNDLPFVRHAALIAGVRNATEATRRPFLHLHSEETPQEPSGQKRKHRKKKSGNSCACRHDCSPCGDCPSSCPSKKGRCFDSLFDCGPGDSGCCDCNPCDGCDCCACP